MAERETFRILGNKEVWEKYCKNGSEDGVARISADDLLNAIAEEKDIDIGYVIIDGDLDVRAIADQIRDDNGRPNIKGKMFIYSSKILDAVDFFGAIFSNKASFGRTTFSNKADFSQVAFSDEIDFWEAIFNGGADFYGATFNNIVSFGRATFNDMAHFANAKMEYPADFSDVHINENTYRAFVCNNILRPLLRPLLHPFVLYVYSDNQLHRTELADLVVDEVVVTDFSGFNTNIMDSASNPYLKRYIDDELWIQSWKNRPVRYRWIRWLRKIGFFLWELTSHCGRSFILWMIWVLAFAIFFGAVYADYTYPSWMLDSWEDFFVCIDPKVGVVESKLITLSGILEQRLPSNFTPYYFSIVTFTTLGFGDVQPLDRTGEIWLAIEVLLGYVMLGGLLSIFTNKFARRS